MSYAPFVLAAIALSAVGLTARRKRKPAAAARKPPSGAAPGALSVLRKARIVEAGARDFGDEVALRRAPAFDLDTTIFRSVDSKAARLMLNDKLSLEPMWSDEAASRALAAFATRARPSPAPALAPDDPLFRFMFDECAFSIEHADGSFMDHLQFCSEYSAAHFPGHSPRVMLLHSILGVGTNYFPMKAEQMPKLAALTTADEFAHAAAFPSVLRLLLARELLPALRSACARGGAAGVSSLKFHRVIDNAPIEFDAAQLFAQLNYQLIHLLDFLPVHDWRANADDLFLEIFADLHDFLRGVGKLEARVDFDNQEPASPADAAPISLAGLIQSTLPSPIKRKIAIKQARRFSEQIGHSLEFELA